MKPFTFTLRDKLECALMALVYRFKSLSGEDAACVLAVLSFATVMFSQSQGVYS